MTKLEPMVNADPIIKGGFVFEDGEIFITNKDVAEAVRQTTASLEGLVEHAGEDDEMSRRKEGGSKENALLSSTSEDAHTDVSERENTIHC